MSADAVFDDKAARKLEAIYRTPDVVEQRNAVLEALDLKPAERVLDIGCGPGFLVADMAGIVGQSGRVDAIDSSANMVAMTRARSVAAPWVEVREADAAALPYPDASFDAATAMQIYLYVRDLSRALAELHRVLKPGGRALVLDTDWASVVWYSTDRPRMRRVLAAWEEHFVDAHIASRLAQALRRAGFQLARQSALPLFNPVYDRETYSAGMISVIRSFVEGRHGISREEAGAWADELRGRGADGSYFFSLNRYLFLAAKPR
jgi:arsenite methyltransferase